MEHRIVIAGILAAASWAGCAGADGEDDTDTDTGVPGRTTTRTLVDDGMACLRGPDGLGPVADVAGEIRVTFDCVGCGTADVSVTCDATLSATDLVVSGTAVLSVAPTPTTITCTCRDVEATCPAPALAAGGYTLRYGEGGAAFDVPAGAAVCVGS